MLHICKRKVSHEQKGEGSPSTLILQYTVVFNQKPNSWMLLRQKSEDFSFMLLTVTSTSGFYSPHLFLFNLRFLQLGLEIYEEGNLIENHTPLGFQKSKQQLINEETQDC
jgi:hypothetical protein